MKKVLVTGASGQLGLTIQDIHKKYENLKFVFKDSKKLDITNLNAIQKIFTNGNFDYCINCAAYTNVEQSEKNPEIAFKINAKGVENLALACKNENVVLIHISTDYVFDGEKQDSYTIHDTPNPINEYGKSKLAGEKYIQQILNNYCIIRTSWLYSKIYGHNFYKTILKKAEAGEQIKVTDQQTGCPTDAVNLATYILDVIITKSKLDGIHHFSDNQQMTWYDFANTIINNNNMNPSELLVLDRNYRTFAKRPIFSVLSKQ